MGVIESLTKPFGVLTKNPILILPSLIFLAIILTPIYYTVFSFVPFSSIIAHPGVTPPTPSISTIIGAIVIIAAIGIIALFVSPLLLGTYVDAYRQGVTGKKPSLSSAFEQAKKRYISLLGALLAVGVITLVVFGIFFAIILAAALVSPVLGVVIGLLFIIILIIAAVLLEILFFQVSVAVMIEGRTAIDALKRSYAIGRAHLFEILAVLILMIIVAWVIGFVVELIAAVFLLGGFTAFIVALVILQVIVNSFVTSWFDMVMAGFYYEYVKPIAKQKKLGASK